MGTARRFVNESLTAERGRVRCAEFGTAPCLVVQTSNLGGTWRVRYLRNGESHRTGEGQMREGSDRAWASPVSHSL